MPPRFVLFMATLAAIAALGACKQDEEPKPASPSPAASSAPISLIDALPSPTPNRSMPSMPPEVAGPFLFYEDFEKGVGRWTITRGDRRVGFHLLKAATCGGLYTMVLGEDKNPATKLTRAESFLTVKQPIDLRKARAAQLQFDVKGETNPPAAARIVAEVREPGGAWTPVGPAAEARFQLVVTFTADLRAYLGKRIELRFRGSTQPARTPGKGFYLDDVHIVEGS